MSGPSQTVNFLPPSYITTLTTTVTSMSGSISSLNSQVASMSGSISILNSQVSTLQSIVAVSCQTGSFTAVSNYTYTLELPVLAYSASVVPVTVTLPASPANGDCVTLIDSGRTWGNTYYNLKVNFGSKTGAGDCANGQLFAARGGNIIYTYSSANNWWYGVSGKISPSSSVLTINAAASTNNDLPFHGWWTLNDMDTSFTVPLLFAAYINYIYIDQTVYPIRMYAFRNWSNRLIVAITQIYINMITNPSNSQELINEADNTLGTAPMNSINRCISSLRISSDSSYITLQGARRIEDAFAYNFVPMFSTRFNRVSNLANLPELQNIEKALTLSSPTYNVFSQTPELFSPVELAKNLFYYNSYKTHVNNNNAGIDDDYIGNRYAAQAAFDSFSSNGVTFVTPIKRVQASYSGPNNVFGANGSTLTTDIYTQEQAHYCTPGSNVTISGFAGAWSALNGYYPNGVSFYEHSCVKTGGLQGAYSDSVLTSTGGIGTWFDVHNKFLLIKDTGDATVYPVSNATGTLGQAVFSGSPLTSVTHRFSNDMTYNEWQAAYMAMCIYIFGNQTHTRNGVTLEDRNTGKLYSVWDFQAGTNNPTVLNYTKPITFTSPNHLIICTQQFFTSFRKYTWGNDPYQTQYYLNIKFYTGTQTSTATPITYNHALPLNYCTGTPQQLFIGLDGTNTKNRVQNYVSTRYSMSGSNIRNVSDINFTGGNYVTAQLVPRDQVTGVFPNRSQWTLSNNSYGAVSVTTSTNFLNYFYATLIDPLYTNGKKIGYMTVPDGGNFWYGVISNNFLGLLPELAPPIPSNTVYTGALGALKVMTTVIKWFNDQNCDGLILDGRFNGGGPDSTWMQLLFGGDRKGRTQYNAPNTDGYSAITKYANSTDSSVNSQVQYMMENVLPSDVARNFTGGVFRGTGSNPADAKKVVYLTTYRSASYGDANTRIWQGDNYDGNLGSNTYAKVMGEVDGRLYGAASGLPLPNYSNGRLKTALSAAINTDAPLQPIVHLTATGPNGLIWNTQRSPFVATKAMATGATGTFKSNIPGVSAMPTSIQSTLWSDWGIVPEDSSSFFSRYINDGKPMPDKNNPNTWRDILLEQAIREACYPTN